MTLDKVSILCYNVDMKSPNTGSDLTNFYPLRKGDVVQRGDIFIDDGNRYEMNRGGMLLGVQCLGQTIRKDNGGWYRPALQLCSYCDGLILPGQPTVPDEWGEAGARMHIGCSVELLDGQDLDRDLGDS